MSISLLQDLLNALTLRDLRIGRNNGAEDGTASTVTALKTECERLLASDGEASSISLARSVFRLYGQLPGKEQPAFFRCLLRDFRADRSAVDAAYAACRENPDSEDAMQSLFEACEPPRQELLRRLNLAPGGTAELVRMRTDLLRALREDTEIKAVDR
ncbi:MAG TPA: malonyl-CoA decarboxylase N-terminal domain-containing protein, partial [Gammaproteobacteria bacterium]|nr:malonyl-CoA decarboxylase N-terminal domain-containing protein [Gammaproteobacteria bacterium]